MSAIEAVGFDAEPATYADIHVTALHIDGMTCGHCEGTVVSAVSSLPGVQEAVAWADQDVAVIWHAADSAVDPQAAIQAIMAVGFDASECCQSASTANTTSATASAVMTSGTTSPVDTEADAALSTASPRDAVDITPVVHGGDAAASPAVPAARAATAKLTVGGMTCASCVGRVERALRAVPGVVSVAVALTMAAASVQFDASICKPAQLVAAVQEVGYESELLSATGPGQSDDSTAGASSEGQAPGAALAALRATEAVTAGIWKRRMQTAMIGALPLFTMYMLIPWVWPAANAALLTQGALGIAGLTWRALVGAVLATPVQVLSGWPFVVRAWAGLKHCTAGMDLLVAIATSISYGYSMIDVLLAIAWGSEYMSHDMFEAAAVLLAFLCGGKYMESSMRGRASDSITSLLELQPAEAQQLCVPDATAAVLRFPPGEGASAQALQQHVAAVLDALAARGVTGATAYGGAEVRTVPVRTVQPGHILRVLPGASVPVDAVVLHGVSEVDESALTGESVPRCKARGDMVHGATVNTTGCLLVQALRADSESSLARVISLVEQAQLDKAPAQEFADRVASMFVPAVLGIALLTFSVWISAWTAGQIPDSWVGKGSSAFLMCLRFALAVIVVACPCALGLATPTAVMVGTGVAAQHGLLFKGGSVFEAAAAVRTVVLDKTGTITRGEPRVTDLVQCSVSRSASGTATPACCVQPVPRGSVSSRPDTSEEAEQQQQQQQSDDSMPESIAAALDDSDGLMALAVAVEQGSEHPVARAIGAAYADSYTAARFEPDPDSSEVIPGMGVRCTIRGVPVSVFSDTALLAHGFELDTTTEDVILRLRSEGKTVVLLSVADQVRAIVAVRDLPRPESQSAISALQHQGIRVVMLTGDARQTALAIAAEVGIAPEDVIADTSPEHKARAVQRLQGSQRGRRPPPRVAFVGDGINDAPALAVADVGMAMASGTAIAVETGDVVLVRSTLVDVVAALALAQAVFLRIRMNLVWALAYNVLCIPLAAGVFYPLWRVGLPPEAAGIAMALSSVSVLASSLLLKRWGITQADLQAMSQSWFWRRISAARRLCGGTRSGFTRLEFHEGQDESLTVDQFQNSCGCKCGRCGGNRWHSVPSVASQAVDADDPNSPMLEMQRTQGCCPDCQCSSVIAVPVKA